MVLPSAAATDHAGATTHVICCFSSDTVNVLIRVRSPILYRFKRLPHISKSHHFIRIPEAAGCICFERFALGFFLEDLCFKNGRIKFSRHFEPSACGCF